MHDAGFPGSHLVAANYCFLFSNGMSIISGSSDGCVYAWCLASGGAEGKPPSLLANSLQCETHKDVVNGIR